MQTGLKTPAWCTLALMGTLTACSGKCSVQHYSFLETQRPSSYVISVVRERMSSPALAGMRLSIAKPPSTIDEICAELVHLHKLVRYREKLAPNIVCERDIKCFEFDGVRLGDEGNKEKMPVTLRLLSNALFQLEAVVFDAKLKFDRVRPSFADPTLTTVIAVPDHPSYPSGHAAQATLIAEILSLLSPSRRQFFMTDAERIARNREIAGLHYHSDSLAGAELARAFLDHLREESWFVGILTRAKQEWRSG